VCHTCFETAYQIGHTTLDDIRSDVAKGFIASAKLPGEDRICDNGSTVKNHPGMIKALSVCTTFILLDR
jgi:hypothetical protein